MPPEGALELDALARQDQRLLLRQHRLAAGGLDELELLEALQPLVDGLEVGEHAAEPALGDVGHADARACSTIDSCAWRLVPTNMTSRRGRPSP
jgi:hypothetical protein